MPGTSPSIYDPPSGCPLQPAMPVGAADLHGRGNRSCWSSRRLTSSDVTCARPKASDDADGSGQAPREALRGSRDRRSRCRRSVDVSFSIERAADAGNRGRVRIWQDHDRPLRPPADRADERADPDRGRRSVDPVARQPPRIRAQMQLVFQEPFELAGSADDGRADRRRTSAASHQAWQGRTRATASRSYWTRSGCRRRTAERYPHQMAAGQQQRVGIARAIATEPRFIVLDEPVSSLDPTARAEIIDLLIDLQERSGITYLFISHDLTTVRYLCNSVAVMYLGKIVEMSADGGALRTPGSSLHPCPAVGGPDAAIPRSGNRSSCLKGEIPSPINLPSGCPSPRALPRGGGAVSHGCPRSWRRSTTVIGCHAFAPASSASARACKRANSAECRPDWNHVEQFGDR